jgi:anti-sigma factor RsiW
MNGDSEPTRDQLLAMAYADDELDQAGRREFESRLAERPDLAREVTQLQRLQILARQMAGPEPMDHEWGRLDDDALHRVGIQGGLMLLLLAAVGLIGWSVAAVAVSDLALWKKLICGSMLGGGLLMLLATIRARLRTLPYDPYTEIQR